MTAQSCDTFPDWCQVIHRADEWGLYDHVAGIDIEARLHEQKLWPGSDDECPAIAVTEFRRADAAGERWFDDAEVVLVSDGRWRPVWEAANLVHELVARFVLWREIAAEVADLQHADRGAQSAA